MYGLSVNRSATAMQSHRPETYPRRILLAVTGRTPQVVTETLHALVTRDPPFVPTEVHVLTTEVGARLFWDGAEAYRRFFLKDYRDIFDAQALALGDVACCEGESFLSSPEAGVISTSIHVFTGSDGEASDIRTPEDNERAGAFIMNAVLKLTRHDDVAVHASMAGGRKTMGFYLGYLMSMFGRDQDRLSHVLVDENCEKTPAFFYPPPAGVETRYVTRDGREFLPGPTSVMLSEIPFIRHRSGFADSDLRQPGMSFSQAVAIAQRAVPKLELTIDVGGRRVTAGGLTVPMKDNPLAWLLWFAEGRLRNAGGATWQTPPREFLACYARILNENASLKWDATNDALKGIGFTPTDFRNRVSAVNRALETALGKLPARPYLIEAVGKKRSGLERPYDLSLAASAISVNP
jgi:CRISPR-associated protein (TIGR02584 family)